MPRARRPQLLDAGSDVVCFSCLDGEHGCDGYHRHLDGRPMTTAAGAPIRCGCPCNVEPWPFEHG